METGFGRLQADAVETHMEPLIVIQARLNSSRLPRKALLPIRGRPLLWWVIWRCQLSGYPVTVATAGQCAPIIDLCEELDCDCVVGSMDDVLGRIWYALYPTKYEHIIRVTGDCPMVEPKLLRSLWTHYSGEDLYALSCGDAAQGFNRYPDGLDAELISREALWKANRWATERFDREHVTPWIIRQGTVGRMCPDKDYGHLKWSVDTISDYLEVKQLMEEMNFTFRWEEALEKAGEDGG